MMGIPTCVQEQNAIAGFTNRILGIFVKAAFTAFPEAGRYSRGGKSTSWATPSGAC